ncbi:MAG TPA: Precorrin-3B methylase [Leptolyngbyaceae cyanobacterium M65_K2018_010]|nr:Precorrin-3B methylase [Leptolyngbyaceae cyanobacterium M65_K2018_010]
MARARAKRTASKATPLPLEGQALVKEVCRRIRVARSYWDAHNNAACRGEREKALALYNTLTPAQKDQIPQALRVWLRYRSEKYFGPHRPPPPTPGHSSQRRPPR